MNAAEKIIKQKAFTKSDIENLSKVFEMGIEWRGSNGEILDDKAVVKITDLQDKDVLKKCIKNINSLIRKGSVKELAKRSTEADFKLSKDDLQLIKGIDPVHDYSLLGDKIYSNISIADAALASAALPGAFKRVKINGKKFSDGGQIKNLPYDILNKGGDSLIMAFKTKEYVSALHENKGNIKTESSFKKFFLTILRLFGVALKKSHVQRRNAELLNVRQDKAFETVLNDPNGVSTMGFGKAEKEKDEGFLRGYFSTMDYLIAYNKHPKAQDLIGLEKKIIGENSLLQKVEERIGVLKRELSKDLSPQDRAAKIDEIAQQEKILNNAVLANPEYKGKIDEFKQFEKSFQLHKSIFENVYQNRNVYQKAGIYQNIVKYCLETENFKGEIEDITENFNKEFPIYNQIKKAAQEMQDKKGLLLDRGKDSSQIKPVIPF